MAKLYTRRIRANDKIPVPPEVKNLLVRNPEEPAVCWNYHADQMVAVLSDVGLAIGFDDYVFANNTDVTDGGRYIRAPDELPDEILDGFKQEKRPASEIVSDSVGISVDELREEMWSSMRGRSDMDQETFDAQFNQEVSNQAGFVVVDELISDTTDHPNIVFLLSERQMWDRLAGELTDTLPDTAGMAWIGVAHPEERMVEIASGLANDLIR